MTRKKIETEVTAIVPALNEGPSVGGVVGALKQSRYIGEVIVVSDGSTDDTASVARNLGATVMELQENHGKAQAMAVGMRYTSSPIILFMDADILNLTVETVDQIVMPVLSGHSDMNVAVRDYGFLLNATQRRYGPLLSGLRCVRREIFESVSQEYLSGFQIETAMNWTCKAIGARYTTFIFYNWQHRFKEQKRGVFVGLRHRVRMYSEVFGAYLRLSYSDLKHKYGFAWKNIRK